MSPNQLLQPTSSPPLRSGNAAPDHGRDDPKRKQNLKVHGVDFADLEDFFAGDLLTREDTRKVYHERRFQSVGVFKGVALFVVWTPRGEDRDIPHLISARKAETHEHKAWQSRYQKR